MKGSKHTHVEVKNIVVKFNENKVISVVGLKQTTVYCFYNFTVTLLNKHPSIA